MSRIKRQAEAAHNGNKNSPPAQPNPAVAKLIKPAVVMAAALAMLATFHPISGQDLLRRISGQQQQQQQQTNSLANIQLPPQLASLSPQQLHQLAQLRELQLQQEAAARQRQSESSAAAQQQAPPPLGLENDQRAMAPTAQPSASQLSGQIPQPNNGETTPTSSSTNNERHDDGSYNESGSEMEGVAMSAGNASGSASQSSQSNNNNSQGGGGGEPAANSVSSSAPSFEVNWNKCPQLEPSESEKNKKTQVITKCLQSAPIPSNLTRENVEAHREQIATCALKVEGWFDDLGQYRYDKAEAEIRGKKLDQAIENQVLKFHVACKDEASKKFPRDQNKLIDQVQFYQACMDYYISIVCEIEVSVDQ